MTNSTVTDVRRTPRRAGTSIFVALVALSAVAGAVGLVTGWLRLDDVAAGRLPFGSPVLGGIALAVVVGAPTTWLAWLAWHGDPRTDVVALITGLLLIGWILIELAFIREFSFFHPAYLAVGAWLIWLGRPGFGEVRGFLAHPGAGGTP